MIQSNELRLGNIITDEWYESYKTIIVVESMDNKGININASDDGKPYGMASPVLDYDRKYNEVFGIPLTEEWLIKLGFESRHSLETKEIVFWDLPGTNVKFLTAGFELMWFDTQVKSVHHLQNLVFTLTGEELTISK